MAAIQPRSAWGARARNSAPAFLPNGVGLAIHWEGPTMGAYSQPSVPALLRSIQLYHQQTQGWADIAYNFVVDRYGGLWEGRGWNARSAANGTNDSNSRYLAVCYLGGEGDDFTPAAQAAIASLYAQHRARGGTAEVVGHRDCTATACPGDTIYTWVHSGGPADSFAPAAVVEAPDMIEADFVRLDRERARANGNLHAAIVKSLAEPIAETNRNLQTLIDLVRSGQMAGGGGQVDARAVADHIIDRVKAAL